MKIIQLFVIALLFLTPFSASAENASITCKISGCGKELCVSKFNKHETPACKKGTPVNPASGCYKDARCARQQNGNCEWVMNSKLEQCLEKAKTPSKTPVKSKAAGKK